jgi:predicted nucleic acid binding AN1-type Zn finger protein
MELPHIGQNCALRECNQLDFLPISCDACSSVYCLEHYRYERHNCDKAKNRDFQVPVCPLCMEPVVGKRDVLPDIAVSEHIDRNCNGNEALKTKLKTAFKKTNLQACSHRSCKQKDLIYLECNDCKSRFCIKHRHPSDHSCPGPKPTSFGAAFTNNLNSLADSCSSGATSSLSMIKNKAQQMTKSGQAALQRLAANSRNHVRSNDGRQTDTSQLANSLQNGLSEQEALTIALQESAAAANGASSTHGPATNSAQIENEDTLLARAIHESELEARRNRTGGNRPQKDSCVLS